MSRKEIITKSEDYASTSLDHYQFPASEGSFVGVLTYRAWHPKGKPCLVCFFDTDNGEHFKLLAWFNNSYAPKDKGINFANDVSNGNSFKCEYKRASGGSITWITASYH